MENVRAESAERARGAGGARRTGRSRRASAILTAALAVLVGVTGCAPAAVPHDAEPSADPATSSDSTDSAVCPDGVVSAQEYGHGPSQQYDLSVIEDALAVTLPGDAACVITVDGDTEDSTAFYVYWPNEDQSFADSIGSALTNAGYRPTSDGVNFSSGSADVNVYAYPAGDDNWSEYFGGASVVLFWGQFDGAPGKKGEAGPAGGGALTWESSCLLTADEMNAAWQSAGVTFGAPEAESDDSTACDYPAIDGDLTIEIDLRPYDSSGSYGWLTGASGSWSAPNAAEGAANACAAATAASADAVCSDVNGAHIVISGASSEEVVFAPGDYLYYVGLFNVAGSDSYADAFTRMADLLSTRQPTAG